MQNLEKKHTQILSEFFPYDWIIAIFQTNMCLLFNKQGGKTLICYIKKIISNVLWLDFVYGMTTPQYHRLMNIDHIS